MAVVGREVGDFLKRAGSPLLMRCTGSEAVRQDDARKDTMIAVKRDDSGSVAGSGDGVANL